MDSREYLIELRTSTGMTRREFCEYYLLRLMAYKAKMEKLAEEKN